MKTLKELCQLIEIRWEVKVDIRRQTDTWADLSIRQSAFNSDKRPEIMKISARYVEEDGWRLLINTVQLSLPVVDL